jgi:hypothetical protein
VLDPERPIREADIRRRIDCHLRAKSDIDHYEATRASGQLWPGVDRANPSAKLEMLMAVRPWRTGSARLPTALKHFALAFRQFGG